MVRAFSAIFFFRFGGREGVFFSLSPQARENTFSEGEPDVDFNNSAICVDARIGDRAPPRGRILISPESNRSPRRDQVEVDAIDRSRLAKRGCPTRQCETKVVINDRVVGAGARKQKGIISRSNCILN
jgi:hypothetical protein